MKLLQRRWMEDCYYGLDMWKGWMRGSGQVEGQQGRGRPRFGLLDGGKTALAVREVCLQEATQLAGERSVWRELVTA